MQSITLNGYDSWLIQYQNNRDIKISKCFLQKRNSNITIDFQELWLKSIIKKMRDIKIINNDVSFKKSKTFAFLMKEEGDFLIIQQSSHSLLPCLKIQHNYIQTKTSIDFWNLSLMAFSTLHNLSLRIKWFQRFLPPM